MGADVTWVAALDDGAVSRGFDSMNEHARRAGNEGSHAFETAAGAGKHLTTEILKGAAAYLGLHKVLESVGDALGAVAEKNDMVASALERIKDGKEQIFANIGRDLAAGLPALDKWLEGFEHFRQAATDKTAMMLRNALPGSEDGSGTSGFDIMGRQAIRDDDMVGQATRGYEGMQKEGKEAAIVFEDALKAQEAAARNRDDILGADKIKARIDLMNDLKEAAKKVKEEGLSGSAAGALQGNARDKFDSALVKADSEEQKRREAEKDKNDREDKQNRTEAQRGDKEQGERRERHRLAIIDLQFQQKEYELSEAKLGKSEAEVAILQRKLDLNKDLAALAKEKDLEDPEKQLLASQARLAASQDILGIMNKEKVSSQEKKAASASSVSGARGVLSQEALFGSGGRGSESPAISEARKQVELNKQAVEKLKSIAEYVRRLADQNGVVAKFGY